MVQNFFDKKSTGSGIATLANKFAVDNQKTKQLAEELDKPIIRNFKKMNSLLWIQRPYLGC